MQITREYINESIIQAEAGRPGSLPDLTGFSSSKVRRLLNWLCQLEGANYLEIGTYAGSTLIPALWGNQATATCIDNFSLYGVRRMPLDSNLAEYLPGRAINIIEGDMFEIDIDLITPGINIYFYDGPHTREGQYQAFVRYDPILAPRFIALVDDWNWAEPREETKRAFKDLGYEIEARWELPATPSRDTERWWNGLFVAIVNKP